jgi:hypothetical protein
VIERLPVKPTPQPPPDLPPAANADPVVVELWHEAEHERHEHLGGPRPRPATPERTADVERLLAHVQRDEGVARAAAVSRVRAFTRAALAAAREAVRVSSPWAARFAACRLSSPFAPRVYDSVMARELATTARAKVRRVAEWTPEPETPPPPAAPDPKLEAMMDAFIASIRPQPAPVSP